ncbi:MAG: glycoside hydrolase family 3 N-terminal domain-containing protein [Rikenellaceae bacterium]
MNNSMKSIAKLLVLMLCVSCAGEQPVATQVVDDPFTNREVDATVDSLYNIMTDGERLAQLMGFRQQELYVDGKISIERCRELLPNGIGHISQFAVMVDQDPNELRDNVKFIQDYLINETPSGIPAIFHEEAVLGFCTKGATTYPQQINMAASWNTELMELKTQYTAESMREAGATMALSPNVDVVRTAKFNRGEEAYGEDGYLTSMMGYAFVKGLQGDGLESGVASCAKHYLGYGGGSESSEKVRYEEIMMPYEVLVRMAGCKTVMTAYHQVDSIYCVFNRNIIEERLRGYMGFDGLLISDYGAVSQKGTNYAERAADALNAGCDLELSTGVCFPSIPEAIEMGLLSEERVEQAVKRNLAMKVRLGLIGKNKSLYKEGDLDFNPKRSQELAYTLATQSVVLLKNNGILPLIDNRYKNIALVGPNADSPWSMLGDYTYQVMHIYHQCQEIDFTSPQVNTLRESMEQRLDSRCNIEYERACDWSMSNEDVDTKELGDPNFIKSKMQRVKAKLKQMSTEKTDWGRAFKIAERSDVIIAAVGENLTLCGEGRGRKGIRLPGEQERLVEEMIDSGKPVILIMFGGRTCVLSDKIIDGAAAIIQAWYPGQEGGNAIADILTGVVNPSAKLCMTYPNEEYNENICYNEGDAIKDKVEYPFGYGLSYTTYDYSDIAMPSSCDLRGEAFEISCTITNSGRRAGDEVVQLYLSPNDPAMPLRPIQLKGFTRVSLKAGESKRVTFVVSPRLMSYYNSDDAKWQLDPGGYTFKIGASSADIRLSASIDLKGSRLITDTRDIYFSEIR